MPKIKRRKRHLIRIPKGAREPKGERSILTKAIERFAPFQDEWVNDDGARIKLTKRRIEKWVDDAARRFNAFIYLERIAPRFSQQTAYFDKLEALSRALAEHLQAADQFTKVALQNNEVQFGRSIKFARGLGRRATMTKRAKERRRKKQGRDIEDRGGNTNIFKELEGPPAWRLVTDLLRIYEQAGIRQATATIEGNFYCFVLEIFEYATGSQDG